MRLPKASTAMWVITSYIHLTIANAYEFKQLIEQHRLEKDLSFMAVIQGYDTASLRFYARELKAIGFALYGIGSQAGLLDHKEILARVRAAMSVVGNTLHVFGVSAIPTTLALKKLGIRSMDSSRPAKAAAYNEVLYSRPFRRFGILDNGEPTGIIPKERCLAKPLPCDCPICQEMSTLTKVAKG